MKKYTVIIKTIQSVEIQANSEGEARDIITKNILAQDPKALFELSVAEEVKTE